MEEERIITIVGSVLAKEGAEFTYAGSPESIGGRIAATRDTHHFKTASYGGFTNGRNKKGATSSGEIAQ